MVTRGLNQDGSQSLGCDAAAREDWFAYEAWQNRLLDMHDKEWELKDKYQHPFITWLCSILFQSFVSCNSSSCSLLIELLLLAGWDLPITMLHVPFEGCLTDPQNSLLSLKYLYQHHKPWHNPQINKFKLIFKVFLLQFVWSCSFSPIPLLSIKPNLSAFCIKVTKGKSSSGITHLWTLFQTRLTLWISVPPIEIKGYTLVLLKKPTRIPFRRTFTNL